MNMIKNNENGINDRKANMEDTSFLKYSQNNFGPKSHGYSAQFGLHQSAMSSTFRQNYKYWDSIINSASSCLAKSLYLKYFYDTANICLSSENKLYKQAAKCLENILTVEVGLEISNEFMEMNGNCLKIIVNNFEQNLSVRKLIDMNRSKAMHDRDRDNQAKTQNESDQKQNRDSHSRHSKPARSPFGFKNSNQFNRSIHDSLNIKQISIFQILALKKYYILKTFTCVKNRPSHTINPNVDLYVTAIESKIDKIIEYYKARKDLLEYKIDRSQVGSEQYEIFCKRLNTEHYSNFEKETDENTDQEEVNLECNHEDLEDESSEMQDKSEPEKIQTDLAGPLTMDQNNAQILQSVPIPSGKAETPILITNQWIELDQSENVRVTVKDQAKNVNGEVMGEVNENVKNQKDQNNDPEQTMNDDNENENGTLENKKESDTVNELMQENGNMDEEDTSKESTNGNVSMHAEAQDESMDNEMHLPQLRETELPYFQQDSIDLEAQDKIFDMDEGSQEDTPRNSQALGDRDRYDCKKSASRGKRFGKNSRSNRYTKNFNEFCNNNSQTPRLDEQDIMRLNLQEADYLNGIVDLLALAPYDNISEIYKSILDDNIKRLGLGLKSYGKLEKMKFDGNSLKILNNHVDTQFQALNNRCTASLNNDESYQLILYLKFDLIQSMILKISKVFTTIKFKLFLRVINLNKNLVGKVLEEMVADKDLSFNYRVEGEFIKFDQTVSRIQGTAIKTPSVDLDKLSLIIRSHEKIKDVNFYFHDNKSSNVDMKKMAANWK